MIKRPPKPYQLIRNEKWLGTFCTYDQLRRIQELSRTQDLKPIRIEIEEGEEKQNLVTLYLADGSKVYL